MTQSGVTPRLLNVEQFKRRINRKDPVANIYRNAIDLNRFGNAISGQIVRDYNSIILSAVDDLRRIDLGVPTAGGGIVSPASVQAQRLRVILAQLKESLDGWANRSTAYASAELQGLAELQTEFVTDQIKLAITGGVADARELLPSQVNALAQVNTVQVAPNFAASVAGIDPTDLNFVLPGTGGFTLTAAQGAAITLPNGDVVEKAFRGLAESQAQRFNTIVRTGILTGEPTSQIARRLVGNLDFGQIAKTAQQQALAGGELIKMADHQIMTVVRTSVQQVSNAASQQVYEANGDITKKYRWLAALEARTCPICRNLDGKEYRYGKGPTPPAHFNCRCTTIAIIDYKGLGIDPPDWGVGPSIRASSTGQVKGNLTYGQWLADPKNAKVKEEALGKSRVPYFDKLSKKYGPQEALARLVREDGSEVPLKILQERYGSANG